MPLAAAAPPGLPRLRLLLQAAGDGPRLLEAQRGGAVARIAVDALGADLGVGEVTAGAALASRSGICCVLFGPRAEIVAALGSHDGSALEIVDAPEALSLIHI